MNPGTLMSIHVDFKCDSNIPYSHVSHLLIAICKFPEAENIQYSTK